MITAQPARAEGSLEPGTVTFGGAVHPGGWAETPLQPDTALRPGCWN